MILPVVMTSEMMTCGGQWQRWKVPLWRERERVVVVDRKRELSLWRERLSVVCLVCLRSILVAVIVVISAANGVFGCVWY